MQKHNHLIHILAHTATAAVVPVHCAKMLNYPQHPEAHCGVLSAIVISVPHRLMKRSFSGPPTFYRKQVSTVTDEPVRRSASPQTCGKGGRSV